jgi:NAD(P)-dependent dehydrogenase (short-subunit alcohol dehydrogenase family)
MPATTFVTGANRGIGLEFVQQLAARGDRVYATCRNPDGATELNAIPGDVRVLQCDVADPQSVNHAADKVEASLDLLINNAGLFGQSLRTRVDEPFDLDEATACLQVNVLGPLLVTRALASKMANPSKAVTISSGYGSIENATGDWPSVYCCSKAAANMAANIMAQRLAKRGITYVSLSPGWVQTDMGGQDASLKPADSVEAMLKTIEDFTTEDVGRFYSHRGEPLPW